MASPLTTVELASRASLELADAGGRKRALADFQQFYLEHVGFVRRVVARLAGPYADVDDAIQEVFLIALRKREGFVGDAAPSTWLYGIAQRVVLAARRRGRLRRFLGLDVAPERADERTPHHIFEHNESSRRLYALLDRLSDKKRTVFILHEIEELPGEAIARIVGCPLSTVWTRLHHARRELQELARALDERSRP
jgi:RNA polymerase sigma-70 factor, ECF subfamily